MRNWDWRLNHYFRILQSLRNKVRIPTQVRLEALFSSSSTFTLKYDQGQPDLNSGKHKGSHRSQHLWAAVTRCHGRGHPETTEMYISQLQRMETAGSKQWHSQSLKRSLFCLKDVNVLEFGIQAAEREKLTVVSPSCELSEPLYQYAWQDVLKGTVVAWWLWE